MASGSTVTLESGLALSYADHGEGPEPVVVMLPGPTDSWRSYQPVLDRLPPDVRAVAVSPRGHGDSDKPPTGYRVEDFASDVVPLLDALDIERAVLAGHSGSCLVARRVALDHSERVAGLVLEASPTCLRDDPAFQVFVASIVSGLEDPIGADFARSFANDMSSATVDPRLLEVVVDELLKVPAHVWHAMFDGLLHYDDMAELDRISAPTVLLWGTADALVSRDAQKQLATCIRGAELRAYPDAGHTPRWDDPARYSGDVAAFTRELRR